MLVVDDVKGSIVVSLFVNKEAEATIHIFKSPRRTKIPTKTEKDEQKERTNERTEKYTDKEN